MVEVERRKAKRIDINVSIKLEKQFAKDDNEEFFASVMNISRIGIAFVTPRRLTIGDEYNAKVELWTREKIDTKIEIVRLDKRKNGENLYGCIFSKIEEYDQLKIDVYQRMFGED